MTFLFINLVRSKNSQKQTTQYIYKKQIDGHKTTLIQSELRTMCPLSPTCPVNSASGFTVCEVGISPTAKPCGEEKGSDVWRRPSTVLGIQGEVFKKKKKRQLLLPTSPDPSAYRNQLIVFKTMHHTLSWIASNQCGEHMRNR